MNIESEREVYLSGRDVIDRDSEDIILFHSCVHCIIFLCTLHNTTLSLARASFVHISRGCANLLPAQKHLYPFMSFGICLAECPVLMQFSN